MPGLKVLSSPLLPGSGRLKEFSSKCIFYLQFLKERSMMYLTEMKSIFSMFILGHQHCSNEKPIQKLCHGHVIITLNSKSYFSQTKIEIRICFSPKVLSF